MANTKDQSSWSFPYTELKQSQVRLLSILPAADSSAPIQARLLTTALDRTGAFDALSYTWGSTDEPVAIQVDDQPFRVTRNLASALRHFRHASDEIRLWADAVCINQADADERSWAVSSMHWQYRVARSTVVWLGDAADDSDLAMDLVARAPAEAVATLHAQALDVSPTPRDRLVFSQSGGAVGAEDDERKWRALDALLNRVWWQRLWIVPEVAFARRCIVHCGSQKLDWDAFSALTRILDQLYGLTGPYAGHCCEWSSVIKELRESSEVQKQRWYLGRLLRMTRRFRTTDPRDHVYVCRLFLPLDDWKRLPVDYRKSPGEVFKDATHVSQMGPADLDSLAQVLATGSADESAMNNLPALMPERARRFSHLPSNYQPFLPHNLTHLVDHEQKQIYPFKHLDNSRTPHDTIIRGIVLGTVEEVDAPQLGPGAGLQEYLRSTWQLACRLGVGESRRPPPERAAGTSADGVATGLPDRWWGALTMGQAPLKTVFEGDFDVDASFVSLINPVQQGTIKEAALGRRFFVTDDGRLGMGPAGMRRGDLYCCIFYCHPPVVLRRHVARWPLASSMRWRKSVGRRSARIGARTAHGEPGTNSSGLPVSVRREATCEASTADSVEMSRGFRLAVRTAHGEAGTTSSGLPVSVRRRRPVRRPLLTFPDGEGVSGPLEDIINGKRTQRFELR